MRTRLTTQIRDYFAYVDEEQGAVELNTMRVPPLTPMPARRFSGPVVAVAAAVAVLVLVGGIALLTGFFEDPPPADTVVPTSIPETVASTSLPVNTTVAPATSGSGINWVNVEWSRVSDDSGVLGGEGLQSIEAVALGGPGLVAVGTDCESFCAPNLGPPPEGVDNQDAAIWVSADGVDWSRIPHDEAVFGGSGRQIITDVVAGGPGLVAVGIIDHSYLGFLRWPGFRPGTLPRDDLDAAVWTSEDGLTWQLVADPDAVFSGTGDGSSPAAGDERMDAIAIGEGRMVAVGTAHNDAAVWVSTDGMSWQRIPHDDDIFGGPSAQWMHDVVYTGERFVAVGTDVNGSLGDPGSMTGSMRGAIWTSEDGLAWSRVQHGAEVFGGGVDAENHMFIGAVTSTANGLVAAGVSACVSRVSNFDVCETTPEDMPMPLWVSEDGLEWERIVDDSAPFAYLATSTKRFPNAVQLRHAPVRALAAFEDGVVAVGWDRGFAQGIQPDTELQFEHGFVPGQLYTRVAMTDVIVVGNRAVAVGHSMGNGAVWIGTTTD